MRTFRILTSLFALALFAVSLTAAPPATPADDDPAATTFNVDAAHSQITFKIRHLGISTVTGSFGSFDADVRLNPADLTSLSTSATIDVASISTGIEKRDDHLRSADFFDVENNPEIMFASKEVRNIDGKNFELVGDLTIRGVTREVVLDAEMRGPASLMGEERVGFTATGQINRTDFGLTWNKVVEAGSLLVGEEVDFTIEIQAVSAAS